jgi:site-specific DNA-cytosine methylase
MREYRVVELYAGVARTWQAFSSWRKCSLALLVDNDEFAKEVYTLNAPKAHYVRRSLRRMTADELATLAGGRVDILLGCPPCQGFSDTGKRDPEDPRNDHITAYGRFIEGLRPLAVVMENVPLLANSPKFQRFKRRLERCGYLYTTQIVNAAQHGSCQTRLRLFLIAIHKTVREQPVIDSPSHGGGGRYFSYQRQLLVPLMFELARMGRHVRTGLVLISQSPSDLNTSVLKRLQTRFIFALEKDQIRAIQGVTADLDERLIAKLPKLPRGVCAVSGSSELVRHGFLLSVRERRTPVGGSTPRVFSARKKVNLPETGSK